MEVEKEVAHAPNVVQKMGSYKTITLDQEIFSFFMRYL